MPRLLALLLLLPRLRAAAPEEPELPPPSARPAPLLAPGGLVWPGPLAPGSPEAAGRELVLVQPDTGRLWLRCTDLELPGEPLELGLHRVWNGSWEWEELDAVAVREHGAVVHRPGRGDLAFPSPGPLLTAEAWPEEGLRSNGANLLRLPTGYRLNLPDGSWEEFDEQGRMTFRSGLRGPSLRVAWSGSRLLGLRSPDGRSITFSPAHHAGVHEAWDARATGGLSVRYTFGPSGELLSARSADGVLHRYYYDAQGRLRAVLWPDGSSLLVHRDEAGRVVALEGPGPQRWTYRWGAEGLEEVQGPGGQLYRLSRGEGSVTVTDSLGRSATLLLDGQGRVRGWRDPGGAETRLEWKDGRLRAVHAPGQDWRFEQGEAGLLALVEPSGARWSYERDALGRLVGVEDPEGRVLELERDGAGRVVALGWGGERLRLERDGAGRVTAIEQPGHRVTRLLRDAAGRVEAVEDPAGDTYRLLAYRGARPSEVLGPDGERWSFPTDLLGRPAGLEAPAFPGASWKRDARGLLSELRLGEARWLLAHEADGRPSRLEDPLGRRTGWSWRGGALASWLLPDGTELCWERDPRGETRSLGAGGGAVEIERDARGLPLSWRLGGEELLAASWDTAGRLVELRWPRGRLALARDAAGRVGEVVLEGPGTLSRWRLDRDPAARVVAVAGPLGKWRIGREPGGLARSLEGPDASWSLERDARGLPASLSYRHPALGVEGELAWQRDGAGRPLAVLADGQRLGIQWDEDGWPRLLRYWGGPLLWLEREASRRRARLEDEAGHPLWEEGAEWDGAGRLARWTEGGAEHRAYYDPRDRLALEEGPEGAWSLTPERVEGPGCAALLRGGRVLEAQSPPGPPAWGLGRSLRYRWEGGVLREVAGEEGSVRLEHDPLGRLHSLVLHRPGQEPEVYAVLYDPFGRVFRLSGPGGTRRLFHAAGQWLGLDGPEGAWSIARGPGGALLAGPAGRLAVALDARGRPAAVLDGEGRFTLFSRSPLGWSSPAPPLGSWPLPSPFPGGPLLGPGGALDPLSGRRTAAPPVSWPWAAEPAGPEALSPSWPRLDGAAEPDWDPGRWLPRSPWSHPLRLLLAMDLLEPPSPENWWCPREEPPALPWLPASTAGGRPPLGPAPGCLPMELDPLLAAFVRAALAPVQAPAAAELLRALGLLDELPEPPPGLRSPLPF